MEAQAEEQAAETQKERKLRERNEQYSRQLEEEMEGLKVSRQKAASTLSSIKVLVGSPLTNPLGSQVKQVGSSGGPASADQTQEVGRLRGDLEKKTLMYEEELGRRETQHSVELKALRKELRDAEGQHLALQKEILVLKDKLDKTRRER